MSKKMTPKQEKKLTMLVILVALIIAACAGLLWWRFHKQAPPVATQAPAPEVRQPVEAPAVIDYDRLDENKQMQTMIDDRKNAYGVKDGLDMIVRPDESIRIGGKTISIQEIIDTIRLHEGEIVEQDVTGYDEQQRALIARRNRLVELELAERRLRELEAQLDADDAGPSDLIEARSKEVERLKPMVDAYQELLQSQQAREQYLELAKTGDDQQKNKAHKALRDLEAHRQELEQMLMLPPIPKKMRNELGIYVVQPGDNIWNIHFRFLRDYFKQRGVELSPLSDEPGKQGKSSGVGKILKFSEKLVFIYNIRERKIEWDLNLIYPRNKLVVYQMERVFNLLAPIELQNVDRIQFDGENIWISAES